MIGRTNAQSSAVTGVKGNSESSYRKGNVNITAANIGAVAKTDAQNLATYTDGVLTIKEIATS